MSILISDCPRCGSKNLSFELKGFTQTRRIKRYFAIYEFFAVCSHCNLGSIFNCNDADEKSAEYIEKNGIHNLSNTLNNFFNINGHVSIADESAIKPPEHIPQEIKEVFIEGARCLNISCFNAAATMFRLCVDLATRGLLPPDNPTGLNGKTRRDLGLRLPWLLNNGLLDSRLKELSLCIKEDGNDGAHVGNLKKVDAEELLDFTVTLLEQMYTIPQRLEGANIRRNSRRTES